MTWKNITQVLNVDVTQFPIDKEGPIIPRDIADEAAWWRTKGPKSLICSDCGEMCELCKEMNLDLPFKNTDAIIAFHTSGHKAPTPPKTRTEQFTSEIGWNRWMRVLDKIQKSTNSCLGCNFRSPNA